MIQLVIKEKNKENQVSLSQMRQERLGGDNQLDREAKGKDTTTE